MNDRIDDADAACVQGMNLKGEPGRDNQVTGSQQWKGRMEQHR